MSCSPSFPLAGKSLIVMAMASITPLLGQDLCVNIGDPAGNFVPKGYCIPVNPGIVGESANIDLQDLPFTVLGDNDDRLDIIVPFLDNSISANPTAPFNYSTSLMWVSTPASRDSVRVRELAVNFYPDETMPMFAPITNLMAGETPPDFLTWVEDPNDATQVIGWTVEQQLDSVPSFDDRMSHYHMTTWNLPVGAEVTFSKSVMGGVVVPHSVPEPSTSSLILVGMVGILCSRLT